MKKSKAISMAVVTCLISVFVFVSAGFAVQTEPSTLNYQGTLTDNAGQPLTGSKNITISLYTVLTGGTAFWSDTYTVTLLNGQFSVTLGSDANPLSSQLSQLNGVTYVGVQVGTDPEMTPRQKFTSVPYALNGIPRGGIIMWSGSTSNIPSGWALCDGTNGTPDLRDRFIVGAGSSYTVGAAGGEATHTLSWEERPVHNHIEGSGVSHDNLRSTTGEVDIEPPIWVAWMYSTTDVGHAYTYSSGGYAGVTQPHENRPPYYALAYIMKL